MGHKVNDCAYLAHSRPPADQSHHQAPSWPPLGFLPNRQGVKPAPNKHKTCHFESQCARGLSPAQLVSLASPIWGHTTLCLTSY